MIKLNLHKQSVMGALCIAILCLVPFATCRAQTDSPRPNIIYINVDDLGWADLGCQGSEFYETPNIDSLAREGMRFTDAYAPAANCAPSRACCLTGQYTPRHGIYTVNNSDRGPAKHRKLIPVKNTMFIQPEDQTIAGVLRSAGYQTCSVGKWHISRDPLLNGFNLNIAGDDDGHPKKGGYFSPFRFPNCVETEPGVNLTDRLTDEAMHFIEDNQRRPFFLYLPYYSVHTPIQSKRKLKGKYKAKTPTSGHNSPSYAAMIENVDTNIGRLLTRLDELELTENTLVLLTSDNGGVWTISKQWPLRAGKGSYYEGGIRVPLIVRWPMQVAAGTVEATPVGGIDFFPTFLEAAGVTCPEDKFLDGISLLPLLTGAHALAERALFWHFPIYLQGKDQQETRDHMFRTRPGSVIRLGKWKLHEYFEDGGIELYDLDSDLSEKNDLAEERPDQAAQLLTMLQDWREQTSAPVPTELNPAYEN